MLDDSLMHWCLAISDESDTSLHNASDLEFITGAHVDTCHSTSAEGFRRLDHFVDDVARVGRGTRGQLLLLTWRLRILTSGTFQSDVETAIDTILFGHLSEFGRDVFKGREVERSDVY